MPIDTSALRGQPADAVQSISVAGASNVTLSAEQARNRRLQFTGLLTGSITITIPVVSDNAGKSWDIYNSTTGAFLITIAGPSGAGLVVPQTRQVQVEWDGVNMVFGHTSALHSDSVSIAVAAAAITLTDQQLSYGVISLTGTPSADRTVLWPAVAGGPWIVVNGTDNAQTCKVTGQTGFAIANGKYAMAFNNGTDLKRLTADT